MQNNQLLIMVKLKKTVGRKAAKRNPDLDDSEIAEDQTIIDVGLTKKEN